MITSPRIRGLVVTNWPFGHKLHTIQDELDTGIVQLAPMCEWPSAKSNPPFSWATGLAAIHFADNFFLDPIRIYIYKIRFEVYCVKFTISQTHPSNSMPPMCPVQRNKICTFHTAPGANVLFGGAARRKQRGQEEEEEDNRHANADISRPEKQWSKTGHFRACLRLMWTKWPLNSQGKWRENVPSNNSI